MIKHEANFGTLFRHWLKSVKWLGPAAFELKQTRAYSLPFSDVQPHQIDALRAAKGDGLLYKIPDDSRGIKPFDMFFLQSANAYIVIRYPDCFCIIDVDTFVGESRRSQRKSLEEFRARVIAKITVDL